MSASRRSEPEGNRLLYSASAASAPVASASTSRRRRATSYRAISAPRPEPSARFKKQDSASRVWPRRAKLRQSGAGLDSLGAPVGVAEALGAASMAGLGSAAGAGSSGPLGPPGRVGPVAGASSGPPPPSAVPLSLYPPGSPP